MESVLKNQSKLLKELFINNFIMSACTFGGGYVIVSFMQKKYVNELHWIEEKEMLDYVALSQSSPGAIAINASIMLGWRMGGLAGMIISVIATILPPMIIISVISIFYQQFAENIYVGAMLKGMRSGVAAIIIDVVLKLGNDVIKQKSIINTLIMIGSFLALYFFEINVIYIILIAMIIGIIKVVLAKHEKEELV